MSRDRVRVNLTDETWQWFAPGETPPMPAVMDFGNGPVPNIVQGSCADVEEHADALRTSNAALRSAVAELKELRAENAQLKASYEDAATYPNGPLVGTHSE